MKGFKQTSQRVEIMDFLRGNKSHPTAEEVYEGVSKKLTRISRATVYSNLKLMVKGGLIKEVNIKGVLRFEPNPVPHHHIICSRCGKIIDFESKELTDYAFKVIGKVRGFSIDSATTNFHGICEKCKEVEKCKKSKKK